MRGSGADPGQVSVEKHYCRALIDLGYLTMHLNVILRFFEQGDIPSKHAAMKQTELFGTQSADIRTAQTSGGR